jgi:hypothetical protein
MWLGILPGPFFRFLDMLALQQAKFHPLPTYETICRTEYSESVTIMQQLEHNSSMSSATTENGIDRLIKEFGVSQDDLIRRGMDNNVLSERFLAAPHSPLPVYHPNTKQTGLPRLRPPERKPSEQITIKTRRRVGSCKASD